MMDGDGLPQDLEMILGRLERILELISDPESLEPELFETLPAEWEALVARLGPACESRSGRSDNQPLKQRLQHIIDRMPETQAVLARSRAEIQKQLSAENRRIVALKTTRYGYQESRLLHRKV
ncbi:MAG: hypothetical protein HQL50_13180 [Magnetococcales bacterium]|nr:hypothetical protein [Magnetococcales bacterium]